MKSVSGAQSAQRRLEDRPPCPQTHLFFLYLSQEHLVELAHDKGAFDLSLLMDPVPAGISSATGITPVPAGKLPGAWSCRPLMGNPAWGGGFTALGWAPWASCQRVLPGLFFPSSTLSSPRRPSSDTSAPAPHLAPRL